MEPVIGGQPSVKQARIADLLPLSWNTALSLSRGRSPRTHWRKRSQAALMMPVLIFVFLMYIPAGDVITTPGRDAVILLTEARNPKKSLQRAASVVAVFLGGLVAFVIWLVALTSLDDSVEPLVALLWPLWFLIGLVLLGPLTGDRLSSLIEALKMRPQGSYWIAQALASDPGAQWRGLEFAKAAIETFVPDGTPILATAATHRIAELYERFGFVRHKPGSLNLIR